MTAITKPSDPIRRYARLVHDATGGPIGANERFWIGSGNLRARLAVKVTVVDQCGKRPWAAFLVLLFASAISSCSSPAHPSASSVSSCGPAYTLRSSQGSTVLEGCAGNLSTVARAVQVSAGQEFQIDSMTEQDGQPDFQAPVTSDPSVVARIGVSGHGGVGRYRALRPGVAILSTRSMFCQGGPGDSTATTTIGSPPVHVCPVLQVTVTG